MFTARSDHAELLDGYHWEDQFARKSFAFMAVVNRMLGSLRATREFVRFESAAAGGRPLRVLDIGCGTCEVPMAVCDWARRKHIDVRFTCMDHHPVAVRLARENLNRRTRGSVEILQEDIFRHRPPRAYDCAVGSLFFHHLGDPSILLLVEHLRTIVSRSVLISDLRRGWGNYLGCLLAWPHLHPGVWNDAVLSVRRGFRVRELRELLRGLPNAWVDVRARPVFRVQAVIRFLKERQ